MTKEEQLAATYLIKKWAKHACTSAERNAAEEGFLDGRATSQVLVEALGLIIHAPQLSLLASNEELLKKIYKTAEAALAKFRGEK